MPDPDFSSSCPIPFDDHPHVLLAHGGGGRMMHQLLEKMVLPAFANPLCEQGNDSATLPVEKGRIAFTTDSYVVRPLFFPGGDIGKIAVLGTLNDLAMSGARPLALSASFIIEEGFSMDQLWRIIESMQRTAETEGVPIVTGDTKVVDRGKGDGIYLNTAGLGRIETDLTISPLSIQPGDRMLVSGDLGRHGVAVMAEREGLSFETTVESDCAALWPLVEACLDRSIEVRALRDLTRGGLAAALIEIANAASRNLGVDQLSIPVCDQVAGACELLGLDPLYVANEGRMVLFVPASDADRCLELLHEFEIARDAAIVGEVLDATEGRVTIRSEIGTTRILDLPSGEQLPRIC